MWPFRRRERGAEERTSGPVHRAPRHEWKQIQPMAVVQAARLSTFDAGFERALSTRRDPSFLAPLGHQLVSSAPSGRFAATARREPISFRPAPVGVQRQAVTFAAPSHPAEVPAPDDVVDPPITSNEAEVAAPSIRHEESVFAVSGPARPVAAASSGGESPPVAARSPDRPSPLVVARTPDLPVATFPTVGPPPAAVADAAGPAADDQPASEDTTVSLTGDKPALISPSAPDLAAEFSRSPEPSSPSGSPARSRPAGTAPQSAQRVVQRQPTTPGPARGSRRPVAPIGPPLARPPVTPTAGPVSRQIAGDAPVSAPSPPAPPTAAQREREDTSPPGVVRTADTTPAVDVTPTAEAPSDVASSSDVAPDAAATPTIQPTPTDADAFGDDPPAADVSSPTTSASPAQVVPTLGLAPPATTVFLPAVTGSRRAAVGTPVQRSVSPAGVVRGARPVPSGVPSPTRTSGASGAITTVTNAPGMSTGRPDVAPTVPIVWRTSIGEPAPSPAPAPTRPAVSRLAEAPTAPGPVAGPTPPTGETVGGIRWSSRAPSVDRLTWSDSGGPRAASGQSPLPRPATPIQRQAGAPSTGSLPPTRPTTGGVTHPIELTDIGWDGAAAFPEAATVADGEWFASPEPAAVQRQADDAATAGPGAAPAPTTMTATATTGPAATTTTPARSGGAPTDAEIDKWTRALYPSFRRRLCQDLLLDRERSGYSTDIRY